MILQQVQEVRVVDMFPSRWIVADASICVADAMKHVTTLAVPDSQRGLRPLSPREYNKLLEEINQAIFNLEDDMSRREPFEQDEQAYSLLMGTYHRMGAMCEARQAGYCTFLNPNFLSMLNDKGEPAFGVISRHNKETRIEICKGFYSSPAMSIWPTIPKCFSDAYAPILKRYEIAGSDNLRITLKSKPTGSMDPQTRAKFNAAKAESSIFETTGGIYIIFEADWNATVEIIKDPLIVGRYISPNYQRAGDLLVFIAAYNPTPLETYVAQNWTIRIP